MNQHLATFLENRANQAARALAPFVWCFVIAGTFCSGSALSDSAHAQQGQCALDPGVLARYQDFDFDTQASQATLAKQQQVRLDGISVVRQRVFEDEKNRLERLANRYHWHTRAAVVLEALPFVQGDLVDARWIAEAERVLRRKAYLYDARILVGKRCGQGQGATAHLVVVVRDVWTLNPRLILNRSGGETEFGIGVSNSNWFGTGVGGSVGYLRDDDRSGVNLVYADSNVAGSRWTINARALQANEGGLYELAIDRPFYSLRSPYAVGMQVSSNERELGLYFLDDELWELDTRSQFASLFVGKRLQQSAGAVSRVLFGVGYEDQRVRAPVGFPDAVQDRRFVYPFIGYQQLTRRFARQRNLDRVERTEDLALGSQLYVQVGYATGAGRSQGQQWLASGNYRYREWLSDHWLASLGAEFRGRYNRRSDAIEELLSSANVGLQRNQGERWRLQLRAQARYSKNLPVDQQLLLGGDTGLRGYPNRYQAGDRSLVLTAEERYYSDRYPLQMFRLGFAAFVDVGKAWFSGRRPDFIPGDQADRFDDTLANVGVGLRLESTRTRRDRVLHIDFAVPLVDGPRLRDVEITIVAKQSL